MKLGNKNKDVRRYNDTNFVLTRIININITTLDHSRPPTKNTWDKNTLKLPGSWLQ